MESRETNLNDIDDKFRILDQVSTSRRGVTILDLAIVVGALTFAGTATGPGGLTAFQGFLVGFSVIFVILSLLLIAEVYSEKSGSSAYKSLLRIVNPHTDPVSSLLNTWVGLNKIRDTTASKIEKLHENARQELDETRKVVLENWLRNDLPDQINKDWSRKKFMLNFLNFSREDQRIAIRLFEELLSNEKYVCDACGYRTPIREEDRPSIRERGLDQP